MLFERFGSLESVVFASKNFVFVVFHDAHSLAKANKERIEVDGMTLSVSKRQGKAHKGKGQALLHVGNIPAWSEETAIRKELEMLFGSFGSIYNITFDTSDKYNNAVLAMDQNTV